MIEAWWRALKHQWLYLNTLDNAAAVQKLVAFYVEQHSTHLPHAAFQGQTPDEMYFATGGDVPQQIAAARIATRQARLMANRAIRCPSCRGVALRASTVETGVVKHVARADQVAFGNLETKGDHPRRAVEAAGGRVAHGDRQQGSIMRAVT
jgi:hypothetical protein